MMSVLGFIKTALRYELATTPPPLLIHLLLLLHASLLCVNAIW